MSAVCPNGHTSQAEDFCDTCGAKIDLENQPEPTSEPTPVAPAPEPEASAPEQQVCPNCSAPNTPDALFCEACGYDFDRALPRGAAATTSTESLELAGPGSAGGSIAPAIPLEWVAEIWVDLEWCTPSRRPRSRCRRRVCRPSWG